LAFGAAFAFVALGLEVFVAFGPAVFFAAGFFTALGFAPAAALALGAALGFAAAFCVEKIEWGKMTCAVD
jgi:hypothetical protein